MSKLFVQVERVEDLIGRADNYFGCDLCGEDSVDATGFAYAEKKKPLNNYDLLRAMSVEEMAEWLRDFGDCDGLNRRCKGFGKCKECWLDLLRQEAASDG